MAGHAERLRAFEAFVALMSDHAPDAGGAARVRASLDAFLADRDAHRAHVDAILRVYGVTVVASRARPLRGLLAAALARDASTAPARLRSLSAQLPAGTPQREAFDAFAGLAAQPRAVVAERPERIRSCLDGFVEAPARYRGHVDAIVTACAPASAVASVPGGDRLLRRTVLPQPRAWRPRLEDLLTRLRQEHAVAANHVPIELNIAFSTVGEPPMPRELAGHARDLRYIRFRVDVHVRPHEGFRMHRLTVTVEIPEPAYFEAAVPAIELHGREISVEQVDTVTDTTTDETKRQAGVTIGVPVPHVPVKLEAGVSRSRTSARRDEAVRTLRQRLPGVLIQAKPLDQVARLELQIEHERAAVAGDGGLPLLAGLWLDALVERSCATLEASVRAEIEAGWYRGRAEHRRALRLPHATD